MAGTWEMRQRIGRRQLLIALLVVAFVVRLGIFYLHTPGFTVTDTYELLDGTGAITHCLSAGTLPCGAAVHEFALLQYLPALAFKEAGVSFTAAARDLIRLNGLCFLALLALAWPLARATGSRVAALAYALALLTGPAVWYGHSSYGELLAALPITALVVGAIAGAGAWVLVPASALAAVSKETAAPFLLLLAYGALLGRARLASEPIGVRRPVAIAAGTAAGVALNFGFNLFRYAELGNQDYLRGQLRVPAGQVLKNLVTLPFAPTSGLVWFWPVACVLIVIALWPVGRRMLQPKAAFAEPAAVAALTLLALFVFLAFWYGPTGGAAWGPRLLLPWLPGIVAVAVTATAALEAVASWLRPLGRRLALAAILVVLALPHLAATANSAHYWHAYPGTATVPGELAMVPFLGDRTCPHYPSIESDGPAYYYRCLNHEMWGRGVALWRGLRHTSEIPWSLLVVYAAAIAAAALAAVGYQPLTRTRTPTSAPGPSPPASLPGRP